MKGLPTVAVVEQDFLPATMTLGITIFLDPLS